MRRGIHLPVTPANQVESGVTNVVSPRRVLCRSRPASQEGNTRFSQMSPSWVPYQKRWRQVQAVASNDVVHDSSISDTVATVILCMLRHLFLHRRNHAGSVLKKSWTMASEHAFFCCMKCCFIRRSLLGEHPINSQSKQNAQWSPHSSAISNCPHRDMELSNALHHKTLKKKFRALLLPQAVANVPPTSMAMDRI